MTKGGSVTDGKNHSISGQRAEGKVAHDSRLGLLER